jgi:hypothetical protein
MRPEERIARRRHPWRLRRNELLKGWRGSAVPKESRESRAVNVASLFRLLGSLPVLKPNHSVAGDRHRLAVTHIGDGVERGSIGHLDLAKNLPVAIKLD